ncbi:MAG: iron-containing alcohol dehydrogenase [Oscillospiraceae bacterium]|nr:iron-containing alcohol dehydrogenase [Oscillospiraceae bacterium]
MLNFDYHAPSRIVFGKDTQKQVGDLLKGYGIKKVLLHYGGGSIKKSGLYDQVIASLKGAGIGWAELGGVKPNPRLTLVREGIALSKKEGAELILAVGGGSVIDSAKAIAAGVCYDGDVWELYQDNSISITKAMPVATILTIPAAGSESSEGTVITDEENSRKYPYNHNLLRPLFSILNPELFFTLPKAQLGYGVADIMSHLFERYFTNTQNTDLTDRLIEANLRTIIKYAPVVYGNMEDYDAWAEIGFGGFTAHGGLFGMGREQDWGCHDMEHELSAYYDVPHGGGLAVLTPAWMTYVYKENVPMFVQFAVNVMGVDGSFRDPDAIVLEGIDRLRAFFKRIGLPGTLAELGIGEDKLEMMAKQGTHTRLSPGQTEKPLGGLKKLYWQDILAIYKLAAK